ncbi:MAG: hypothetical protein GF401_04270 [Chitinivibrionales bacterium]|nr:hypothetical protein [Chitinivibrionales bacterium]
MHVFDIIISIIAALFIIVGIKRGLIGEAFRLIALIAGFAVAVTGYRTLFPHLTFIPLSDSTKLVISFLLLFFATVILVLGTGWLIRKIVRLTVLGWVDRLCGGCIGLIKAFIIAWIFVLSAVSSPFPWVEDKLGDSIVFSYLSKFPPHLSVPYMESTKKSFEKIIGSQPLQTIKDVHHKVDSFKTKVDSAMTKTKMKGK